MGSEMCIRDSNVAQEIIQRAKDYYERKEQYLGAEQLRYLEKFVMLRTMDEKWRDHLYSMDQLKEGINWRAYGQKDPLLEYKGEAYKAFVEIIDEINKESLRMCFRAQFGGPPVEQQLRRPQRFQMQHEDSTGLGLAAGASQQQELRRMQSDDRPRKQAPVHVGKKSGRNDPCPCGSGKKYKKCHGANL